MDILRPDSINPYQSPAINDCGPDGNSDGLVRRGFFYRVIRLSAPFDVDVEYNLWGLGCEYVRVNGVLAKKQLHAWYDLRFVVPHIDFELRTASGTFASSIDVRVKPWFAIRYLSLRIEGDDVYREGSP